MAEASTGAQPRRGGGLLSRWLRRDGDPVPPTESEGADQELVDQAEAFQTVRVAEVMTPRADILALEVSTPLLDVVGRFVESEHSRMPVYRETLDDPIGVVHIKDLLRMIAPAGGEPETAAGPPWREPVLHRLRRELLYVPASMRAADLLLRMRVERTHMALVIDEFGGTDGLVTLEDLVEAVVGEIADEHDDQEEASIVARAGGLLEADARVPLEELEHLLGHALTRPDEDEEVDTVAGLVSTLAGRVPQRGEVIVHPDGVEFEVVEADPRRIHRLRIRPAPGGAAQASPTADGAQVQAAGTASGARPNVSP